MSEHGKFGLVNFASFWDFCTPAIHDKSLSDSRPERGTLNWGVRQKID
jgi:hypothetical protein